LGSRNGTRVNDAVLQGAERILAAGDVISVGPAEIIVAVSSPKVAGRTAQKASASAESQAFFEDAEFVVADEAMVKVYQVVQRLARAQTTVLILGETGVGKEVVSEQ